MGLTWWMWLGALAATGIAVVASGFHWAAVDFVLDRFGTRDGGGDSSEPALPRG